MDISALTSQQMREIVIDVYRIGRESEHLKANELIEEIKRQIMLVLREEVTCQS
ncbi:hypothetical protein [Paenibacillus alba]|uniref:Aspartyl-phosphate phosphatase Spo0E family protein n=1 Tax=Paenibacillus alba TaxID=1197127 RepID=A0ABU6G1I9_9BACL|nr:hypothetical protein [Paenibacillus alba]MEC0228033.1 hypothetical protein [Paenibacillus alba]